MAISLSVFLYFYYGFLVIWGILCLVALYHMFKYSLKNMTSFLVMLLFLGVSAAMLLVTFSQINAINWQNEITLFESLLNPSNPF